LADVDQAADRHVCTRHVPVPGTRTGPVWARPLLNRPSGGGSWNRHARLGRPVKVTIAGAGMAGLVAAARLRELGHEPRVLEKGTRLGGSMLLSSCVIWRHLEWEGFRAECPGGDERLQRLIWERLDDSLGWLESLGAQAVWHDTENPLTTGRRYDPCALTRLLAGAAGEVQFERP